MKNIKLFTAMAGILLFIGSCTKKETIIQEYNPPQPSLYGTWKSMNMSPGTEQYWVFSNDGSNFLYFLTSNKGLRQKDGYPYTATDKQVQYASTLFNYSQSGDTLIMMSNLGNSTRLIKVPNPGFTPNDWMGTLSYSRSIDVPFQIRNGVRSFAVNGDFLFVSGYTSASGYQTYQFNTLTEKLVDSFTMSTQAALAHKSGTLYYGYYNNSQLYKGSYAPTTAVSNNNIYYAQSVSVNGSSGVIYAHDSYSKLMTGTENSTFSELFDFSTYNIGSVQYYSNDEFLGLYNNSLHRFKISPSFTVLKSYLRMNSFDIYYYGTDGSSVWVFGYDGISQSYKFRKVSL